MQHSVLFLGTLNFSPFSCCKNFKSLDEQAAAQAIKS
jgi:hypothetical protein